MLWLFFGTRMRGFHNSSQLGCSNSQALYSKARILLEGYNGLNPNLIYPCTNTSRVKSATLWSTWYLCIYVIYIYMHMIMYGLCMHYVCIILYVSYTWWTKMPWHSSCSENHDLSCAVARAKSPHWPLQKPSEGKIGATKSVVNNCVYMYTKCIKFQWWGRDQVTACFCPPVFRAFHNAYKII